MSDLILPEHLLLLALHDENGSVIGSSSMALPYALNGALIMELSLRGCIEFNEKKLDVKSCAPSGDDLLDEALASLVATIRAKTAQYWIARPNSLVSDLKRRLIDRLVEREILRREERQFLWLIPYERYPMADFGPECDIRTRVRDVLMDGAEADESTALLLSLVHACNLGGEVFPDRDRRETRKLLKRFAEGELIGKAVSNQVTAITMAIVTSSLAITITSSSG